MSEAQYLRVTLKFAPVLPAREVAVAYLSNNGFDMFEEEGDDMLIAYAKDSEWEEDGYRETLSSLREFTQVEVQESWVKSENWNAKWEANYDPIDVDGIIMMRAPFHDPPASGLDVIIQPEMSFGTGHHPTTWQMMHAVYRLNPTDRVVLDMGCGTGALAIAAKKLGASRVVAIDNDEWSYRNTLDNIRRNEIKNGIDSYLGDSRKLDELEVTFDIVLANINRNVLMKDMEVYSKNLVSGGSLVLSGFFPADAPMLIKEASANGLSLTESQERDGWSCLLFVNSHD
jgi:ribosomal protein L11 methyltransferase